ncbi:MAG: F0F1 ATP synthase subunit A [Gemmatimonadaceae bacterium]
MKKTGSFLAALLLAGSVLGAQESHATPSPRTDSATVSPVQALDSAAAHASQVTAAEIRQGATPAEAGEGGEHHVAGCEEFAKGDFITPHISDAHCIDVPGFPRFWEVHEKPLPRWAPFHIGGLEVDMSPTKHVIFLLLSGAIVAILMLVTAAAHTRHTHAIGRPKGFAAGMEAMVLFIRNEVALPNLGPHGEGYAPFILTLFFFILTLNLFGLVPFGSTATGNISVTATLALVTFLVVESAGVRENGLGYLGTIFYWNKELPTLVRFPMFVLMTPIELAGKFTKPFALAIRLLANMTAGHIVVLALIGLVFAFKSVVIGVVPALAAVGIMMLELFVSFLQAFIFALLASVFIGQMREGHH